MKKEKQAHGGALVRPGAGNTMNPNGRPKGSISFKAILNKILDSEMTVEEAGEKRKITRREMILLRIVSDAANDEDPAIRLRAVQFITDRTEGKAPETINATVQSFTTPGAINADELEQILRIVKIEPKSEE